MTPPAPSTAALDALLRLWGWPLLLAALTTSGLISALLSDGWGDVWSWFALGLPMLAMTRQLLRRAPPPRP